MVFLSCHITWSGQSSGTITVRLYRPCSQGHTYVTTLAMNLPGTTMSFIWHPQGFRQGQYIVKVRDSNGNRDESSEFAVPSIRAQDM